MLTLPRQDAIRTIRAKLIEMTDEDPSTCQVASEKGIYCRGFRQFTDEQLKERYAWMLKRHPGACREELEDMANRSQLARQIVDRVSLSCDVKQIEHNTCTGWDGFSDEDLARFYRQLLGSEITIAD